MRWMMLGPAFVASIAYVDPGNVAANISAGAQFGYTPVWVLVAANIMSMFIQYQSAKLGIVTGKSLPEVLGQRLRTPTRLSFWVQAEVVAAATDLAEVIGGAIALNLLFDVPLLLGALITGAISMGLLAFQRGRRAFERVIIGLLIMICAGFLAGLFVDPPSAGQTIQGLVPRLENREAVILTASMLGATVMPHAIYLHSSLVKDTGEGNIKDLLKQTRSSIIVALTAAGVVNISLLLVAASSLAGVPGTDTIAGAHAAILENLGTTVAGLFALGLFASGLASTSVGTYAGSEIMAGLLHTRIPLLARRAITLVPAIGIIATGVEPSTALVLSQAILSLGIPFALIPLMRYVSSPAIMGEFAAGWGSRAIAVVLSTAIVALNIALVIALF